MGLDYFIYYAEGNFVCIIILLMLLINDKLHSSLQDKQVWFNRTLIAHVLYFLSDIGWASVLGGQLLKTRDLVVFFNFSNYVLLGLIGYEWFMYMAVSEKIFFYKDRKMHIFWQMPLIVSVVLMIIAYLVDSYFWIDASLELNGLYYVLLVSVPTAYLLIAFIFSMMNFRRAKAFDEKKMYFLIGVYPLFVVLFGVIQLLFLKVPLFCFGVTTMLVFFYIQNMNTLISVDALTKLNNRGQINRYMEQIVYREDNDVYVMMLDLDNFKSINDVYGHAEGDRALVMVADVLKKIGLTVKRPMFIGRYGGDEFVIIIQNPTEHDMPEQIVSRIRSGLWGQKWDNSLPYDLDVSVGYDKLVGECDTVSACMARADIFMYKDKMREKVRTDVEKTVW